MNFQRPGLYILGADFDEYSVCTVDKLYPDEALNPGYVSLSRLLQMLFVLPENNHSPWQIIRANSKYILRIYQIQH